MLLGPGAALLQSGGAYAGRREPLIQPSEIRSQNGVLDATLTAAPRDTFFRGPSRIFVGIPYFEIPNLL
jgi:hypothetical protein